MTTINIDWLRNEISEAEKKVGFNSTSLSQKINESRLLTLKSVLEECKEVENNGWIKIEEDGSNLPEKPIYCYVLRHDLRIGELWLKIEWGNSNFVNPPYSQKLKEEFIKKGVEEMKKGKVCVFLIPVSTSTKLFHEWIKPYATEIEFVKGRIKFGKRDENGNFFLPLNDKGKTQSGTKDSMVVVFDGRS